MPKVSQTSIKAKVAPPAVSRGRGKNQVRKVKSVRVKKNVSTKASRTAPTHELSKTTEGTEKTGISSVVFSPKGDAQGKVELPAELFAASINRPLLAQAVRVYLANQRQGSASTKTRGEVEGSTRKIYRQKGTGRARHGAIRAPIFVKGGIVFGPRPRDFSLSLSKPMRRGALVSALTAKWRDGKVLIVEGLAGLAPKTKLLDQALRAIESPKPLLLIVDAKVKTVVRAARNLAEVEVIPVQNLNAYKILAAKSLVFMKEALPILRETFLKPESLKNT